MAVLSREDLMSRVQSILGEDTSDDSLQFIEDISDTFDSFENNSGEDWKKKYEENDASWRKKYRDRFTQGSEKGDFDENNEQKRTSFASLFDNK